MRRRKKGQADAGEPGAPPSAEQAGPGRSERRLTPIDVQQKEFRGARWGRGYHEGDVDQFLDELTEEVARLHAENKRLREESEYRGTARLSTDVPVEGEAIVRKAREEANQIISDAQSRARAFSAEQGRDTGSRGDEPAAGAGSAGASPLAGITDTPEWRAGLGRFLSREKEFLQSMAALIQRHAEGVKDDAQRARDEAAEMASASRATEYSTRSEPAVVTGTSSEGPAPPSVPAAGEEPALPTEEREKEPSRSSDRGGGRDASRPKAERIIDLTPGEGRAGSEDDPAASVSRGEDGRSAESAEGVDELGAEPAEDEWLHAAPQSTGARSREARDAETASEERSIREMFWGEE